MGSAALVSIETADAADYPLEPEAWDAALCLGASFVWGHIGDAATALVPAVRPGGFVAIGEPFWHQEGVEADGFVDLAATVERFQSAGLALTGLIAASEDDWDRYESLHWRALEEWLAANPEHPDAAAMRERNTSPLATTTSARSGRSSAGRSSPVARADPRGRATRAPEGGYETGTVVSENAACNGTSKRATPAASVVTVPASEFSARSPSRSRARG